MAASQYNLTAMIAANLDPHMVLPLLDFAESTGSFNVDTITKSRLQVLDSTQMVDFYNEVYVEAFGDDGPHEGLNSKPRDVVISRYTKLHSQCKPLLDIIDEKKGLMSDRVALNAAMLLADHGIDAPQIEVLYEYAKFMFDCGRYQDAAENLFFYRMLSKNEARCFQALWGQLATDILLTHWDDALVGLNQLSDSIEQMASIPQVDQLKYRTWLVHWGLFIFFNHENGRSSLIEFLNKERYMNTVQTSCPHILRYLTTAVVINRRRRTALNDLIKLIAKLSYVYSDPVTDFLKALYMDYDFELAFTKLGECEQVLSDDFFLNYIKDEFIDNARLFYFEMYFRSHHTVSIKMVSEALSVTIDEGERWIVDLIRSLGLDARIDSHANNVVMTKDYPSIYQHVIDKTKSLTFRTNQLIGLVDKKYLSLQD
uniref:Eukaryotic translation initiation factor 3 subunit E n=1 Tax=Spongospora subterranea TaxID=70186 RepID=A0A0H5R643_9EUKA|eukprot:CRZ09242.1 hypothetical protein [Spongospora subterranea]